MTPCKKLQTNQMSKSVQAIVAVARNGIIGCDNGSRMPWRIPEDFGYFVDNTKDGVIIWGSKCQHEFGALPDRGFVVLTRDKSMTFPDENVDVAHSLLEAISKAQTVTKYPGPVWICGGEAVYAEGLPLCDKLYITRIHSDFEGDRSFPKDWQKYFSKLSYSRDSEHEGVTFTFEVWEK